MCCMHAQETERVETFMKRILKYKNKHDPIEGQASFFSDCFAFLSVLMYLLSIVFEFDALRVRPHRR